MAFDFKNSSKEALKAEYDRIAAQIGDDQFFTKKELNHLPEVLADGEQVLAFTSGLMDRVFSLARLAFKIVPALALSTTYGRKPLSHLPIWSET